MNSHCMWIDDKLMAGTLTGLTATGATSKVPNIEEMVALVKQMEDLRPKDLPDVYIMTTAVLLKVRAALEESKPWQEHRSLWPESIYGIPMEHYATDVQVTRRYLELKEQGKQPCLVTCDKEPE
jgi:hypothetical protein